MSPFMKQKKRWQKKQKKMKQDQNQPQHRKNLAPNPVRTKCLILGDSMLKNLVTSRNFAIVKSIRGGCLQETHTFNNDFCGDSMFSAWRLIKGKERVEKLKRIILFVGRKVL